MDKKKKTGVLLAVLLVVAAVTAAGWEMGFGKSVPGKQMALETVGSAGQDSGNQMGQDSGNQMGQEAGNQAGRIPWENRIQTLGGNGPQGVKSGEPYLARLTGQGRFLEGEMPGGAVLEDRDFFYFYSGCEIRKISKENNETAVIWKSGDTEEVSLGGSAVLAGDKIFFLERWWTHGWIRETLSVVNTDGTGYERMEERKRSGGFLYLWEGHLYVEDGAPAQGKEGFYRNGNSVWEYGIYTDGTWEKLRTLTGHVGRVLPDAVKTGETVFARGEYILPDRENGWYLTDSEDGLYLTDRITLEKRFLGEYSGIVIGMDEANVYLCRKDTGVDGDDSLVYEKLGIEDGEKSILFVQNGFSDSHAIDTITGSYGMAQITDGFIYSVEESVGKLYLARRSLDDPSCREVLGDAFFDSGLGEVGRVEKYFAETRSQVNPEWGYVTVDLERLVVDESFPGAAGINRFLEEIQENIIAFEEDNYQYMEEFLEESGEKLAASEEGRPHIVNSYDSVLSPVFRYGNRYISFYYEGEDYRYGQLHGTVYRRGHTFDLLTGERLGLEDVVENSRDEINEIVTGYFSAMIRECPEYFWEDAEDIVREQIGMESDFYLKEEGICFYLPPYAIAAFVHGIQEVTVPYGEFDMKID